MKINFAYLMAEQSKQYNYFNVSFFITLFLIAATGIFLLIHGKLGSFLIINSRHNAFFDFFFTYFTYFGDGLIWIPLALYCLIKKRKFIIALAAAIIISTLITQLLKRVVFADELRPVTFLSDTFPVHVIKGIFMNRMHSFPSGHTATAFSLTLLLSYMLSKKWWSVFLPFVAFGVAYSRVYQAQHFVTDAAGGMLIGIISAYLSVLIHTSFLKRSMMHELPVEEADINKK